MTTAVSRSPIEKNAVVAGLLSFFVLVVVLPFVAILVASFGPSEWVAEYVAPAKSYEFVLLILVGVVTAWRSRKAPMTNTIFVGLVGGISMLLVAFALQASPHLGLASAVFRYVFLSVGCCSLGAAIVWSLRRNQHAL